MHRMRLPAGQRLEILHVVASSICNLSLTYSLRQLIQRRH